MALTEQGSLKHVVPGSWINANFDVWIGADEDNRAWDLLADARDFLSKNAANPTVGPEAIKMAQEELWIAEGSDWNWWYGPEHSTPNDEQFDRLYRTHLSNIYRLLDGCPPDALAAPIKRLKIWDVAIPASGLVEATIDGVVTSYFEWMGAGVYTPDKRAGSMHGAAQFFEALYYGYSLEALYLRLDLTSAFLEDHEEFDVRVNVCGEVPTRLHATISKGKLGRVQFWKGDALADAAPAAPDGLQVAFSKILEIKLGFHLLGLKL